MLKTVQAFQPPHYGRTFYTLIATSAWNSLAASETLRQRRPPFESKNIVGT